MTRVYKISGMTCGNCKDSVTKSLNKLNEITNVAIDLNTKEATITMTKPVALIALQNLLAPKYTIIEKKPIASSVSSGLKTEEETSKIQQLKPLLLILLYIAVASILMDSKNWNIKEIMLNFMGLFFIVFSFFKMLDLKGFPESFRMYDPLAKKIPMYGTIYPFIETALGLMFLGRFKIKIALLCTLVILGITTIGIIKTLINKKSIRCACLGTVLKLPMTEATFIENAIMIIMALLMLLNIF